LYVPKFEKTILKKNEYNLLTYKYKDNFYHHVKSKLGYEADDYFDSDWIEPRIMATILYFLELEILITKQQEEFGVTFD